MILQTRCLQYWVLKKGKLTADSQEKKPRLKQFRVAFLFSKPKENSRRSGACLKARGNAPHLFKVHMICSTPRRHTTFLRQPQDKAKRIVSVPYPFSWEVNRKPLPVLHDRGRGWKAKKQNKECKACWGSLLQKICLFLNLRLGQGQINTSRLRWQKILIILCETVFHLW